MSNNEEKNRVTAKLGIHKFTIRSHKSSEHIQQVSRDINQYLSDIEKHNPAMSLEEMALLVSLNIQSDNLDLQAQVDAMAKENADLLVRIKSLEHTMGTLVKEIAQIEKDKIQKEQEEKLAKAQASQVKKAPARKTATAPTKKQTPVKQQDVVVTKEAAEAVNDLEKLQQPSLKSGVQIASNQLGRLRQTPRS
ncbi:cell division protein ZapA [Aerococcus agrisoli]|uniref:Cell division protein ZapA n=1 Tax=Aerococcus agrisoli TaxID=2487350 RepID=A0A3N4GFX8_9LACT|nr:cell division protein ZapA [Aerococcus agrisoli]RPA59566.1 cell division protein ZapA [Aerococcus agrisoli]